MNGEKLEAASFGLFSAKGQTSAGAACDDFAAIIENFAIDEAYCPPVMDGLCHCLKVSFFEGTQVIDLQFDSRESFVVIQSSRISKSHGCVGYVDKDATVQRSHGVPEALVNIDLNGSRTGFDVRKAKAQRLRDRRNLSVPAHH